MPQLLLAPLLLLAAAFHAAHPQGQEGPAGAREEGAAGASALPQPGTLPEDASPRARELWRALLAPHQGLDPIRAFDLSFWMRHRSQEGRQQNDVDARYRFRMPHFVRVELQSGRELLRGPQGDYLIDKDEVVELSGRGNVEDRQQLSEAVAIARNFLSLTDPARLRIVRLALREGPPHGLPAALAEAAQELSWLEITSPDFHLAPRGAGGTPAPGVSAEARLYRVALGISAVDARPLLAVIHEELRGTPTLSPASMLVELRRYAELDGYRIPQRLHVHEVDLSQSPWIFAARPTSELALKPKPVTVGFRPDLTPESFVP